jgi:hypothetical protein
MAATKGPGESLIVVARYASDSGDSGFRHANATIWGNAWVATHFRIG